MEKYKGQPAKNNSNLQSLRYSNEIVSEPLPNLNMKFGPVACQENELTTELSDI